MTTKRDFILRGSYFCGKYTNPFLSLFLSVCSHFQIPVPKLCNMHVAWLPRCLSLFRSFTSIVISPHRIFYFNDYRQQFMWLPKLLSYYAVSSSGDYCYYHPICWVSLLFTAFITCSFSCVLLWCTHTVLLYILLHVYYIAITRV